MYLNRYRKWLYIALKCFILAAGFGTRMEDLTKDIPKPLLLYKEKTLLDHSISFALSLGIQEFIINTHYLAEKIHDHLEKYTDLKIKISYEEKILGTGGGLKLGIENLLQKNEHFLVMNPDLFFVSKNLEELRKIISNYSGKCLLFLSEKSKNDSNTSLNLSKNKVSFEDGKFLYIGLSVMNASILVDLKLNEFFDISKIFRELSLQNNLDGEIFFGDVYDLGDKKKYLDFIS